MCIYDCQTGFLGLWGKKVDAIEHYHSEIEKMEKEVSIGLPFLCQVYTAIFVSLFQMQSEFFLRYLKKGRGLEMIPCLSWQLPLCPSKADGVLLFVHKLSSLEILLLG